MFFSLLKKLMADGRLLTDSDRVHITSVQPSCSKTNAYSNAASFKNLYRSLAEKCPALISVFSKISPSPFCAALSFATHFAGSQYCTRGSHSPPVASTAGYTCGTTLSYGEYDSMYSWNSSSLGFPHSAYSATVSGIVGSDMVFMTSTKGTSATAARKRCGARLRTAPMRRPPAERPQMASLEGEVAWRVEVRWVAHAMKSVKVLRLVRNLP
mmetsp:Transcript_25499/g.63687  ORF Transcript_25499/g.63687 Transcript_25499/m.63687 type:complete len:212 (+) Transcript_25499:18-653(+)